MRKKKLYAHGRFLYRYLQPMKRRVVLMFVCLLISVTLQLLGPLLIREFVDLARAGGAVQTLYTLAVLFMGCALVGQGFHVIVVYVGEHIGWQATNTLRVELLQHYLQLDLAAQQSFSAGEMVERIDGDTVVLQNFFSHFIVVLVGNAVFVIAVIGVLFHADWRIGSAIACFTLFALIAIEKMRRLAVPHWQRLRAFSGRFFGFLSEQLAGTEEMRANGGRAYVMWRFDALLQAWFLPYKQAHMRGYALWMTTIMTFTLGNAAIFAVSAWLFQAGAMTLGTVFMVFYFTELLIKPIEQIRNQMEDLQKAEASMRRVEALLQLQANVTSGASRPLPAGALSVDVQHVSYRYESGAEVLSQLYFHVGAGRVLGLLGKSGSGKTTLGRLLLRFYEPNEGMITLGGVPLSEVTLAQVRQRVALVTQEVQLFYATLRDNVTFFDRDVPDEKICAVIEQLGLIAWYEALPHGLDTVILGEDGVQLSGGEAQLLACMRVFLADPGLIIFDEASARMDRATEVMFAHAIEKLLAGRTAVIIAHRLATVQHADDILILADGHIAEHGTRKQLVADPESHFSHLLRGERGEMLR